MVIHDLEPVVPSSGFFICSRLKNRAGNWASQDDFSSILLRVVVEETDELVSSATPDVATVIFDTLQTDGRWVKDRLGYNFGYPTIAAETPDADTTYLFKFQFTPTSGTPFYEYFRVTTLSPTFA